MFDSLFENEQQTESRSQATPWAPAIPGLLEGIGNLTNWMDRPMQFFPGQTYAELSPDERAAMDMLRGAAGAGSGLYEGFVGGVPSAYQAALGGPENVLGMGLQDVASNPYLAGIADVMEARSEERMLEDVLPQMRAGAIGLGGLGGSRLAVNAQQAERDRQRALDDALAGLYGQAWQSGLGAETARYNQALAGRSSALGQFPALTSTAMMPANYLLQAGGMERAEEQRGINEAMARHQFAQMEPYNRATLGMQALLSPAQAFGEQRREERGTITPSTFGQIGQLVGLGGALGGALGGMGPFGGGGGFGAAGGYGMGPMGYGMGYGIDPYGQQAQMLAQQWGPNMWG